MRNVRSPAMHIVALLTVAACATLPAVPEPEPELWNQVAEARAGVVDVSAPVDLTRITHIHDLAANPDVPRYTSVVLKAGGGASTDLDHGAHAYLTLYNIDPPLEDLPSRDAGVDRGLDFRDPSNLVKSAYSNYVSPVFTAAERRRPVPGHPIGHFLVKLELPGHPTLLTGMTTIERADAELVDLTLGQQLGIGGVLLTPQPGRLNSAAEAEHELSLRQEPLDVVDGVNYRPGILHRGGPTLRIEDGNVTFARFKLPNENARDGLAFFHEYVRRGVHNIFGSLINRPHKGTGAGCATFAMAWLKATGVISLVDEADIDTFLAEVRARGGEPPFWANFRRQVRLPWAHVGCDRRVGADGVYPAEFTVYDLLFHDLGATEVISASPGLARQIRRDHGIVIGTLFQFGALTPLRDILIHSKRNDPDDTGHYDWAADDEGIAISIWENDLFSDWVKGQWAAPDPAGSVTLVREGRFYGVEIDATNVPRQRHRFFARADQITGERRSRRETKLTANSCRAVFELGLQ